MLLVFRYALAAYDQCGDADSAAIASDAWTPERLYWGAGSPKRRATIRLEMERRGLLDEPIDEERRRRLDEMMAQPEPAVSVVIDSRRYIESRRCASSMHRTQFGENGMFARVPEDLAADFFGEERFWQARPTWPEDQAPSNDFA